MGRIYIVLIISIMYDWYRICKKRRQNKKTKDVYEKLF